MTKEASTAAYIADVCAQLAKMAGANNQSTIADLLAMVVLEASREAAGILNQSTPIRLDS